MIRLTKILPYFTVTIMSDSDQKEIVFVRWNVMSEAVCV